MQSWLKRGVSSIRASSCPCVIHLGKSCGSVRTNKLHLGVGTCLCVCVYPAPGAKHVFVCAYAAPVFVCAWCL